MADDPTSGTSTRRRSDADGKSRVTLERLQKIARFLRPLKWVAFSAFGIFVIAFILSVTQDHLDRYIIPSVVGGMWAMLLYAFIAGFQAIPVAAPPNSSISTRMSVSLARGAYWLLAFLTGVASLGALVLTFRLVLIWSSQHSV